MTKTDIISGFLGAGKTTLIQKLLKDVFQGEKVVLVENEFGEIGIDGGFLKEAGIVINEINGGCVCCTLQGDFKAALEKVIDEYHPDRIIIEPSGVGKLSDILDIVKAVPELEINSYSAVVDAKRCEIYHKNFKEFFDDQIKTAQCVILSRTQMVDFNTLDKDNEIIHELNPHARVVATAWDSLSGQEIFEAMEGTEENGMPISLSMLGNEEHSCGCHHDHEDEHECCHSHHHEEDHECGCHHDHEEEHECCHGHHHEEDHECGCHHDHDEEHECCHGHHEDGEECHCHNHDHHHDHDKEAKANEGLSEGNRIHLGDGNHEHHHHHHHHGGHDADEVFDSIGIETINRYSKEEIEVALGKLGNNIVRAKGIVPRHDGSWLFFDYVPGDTDIREGKAAYTGLITVIGEHVNVEEIKEIFGVK